MTTLERILLSLVALGSLFLAGCGGTKETTAIDPTQEVLVKDAGELLKAHAKDFKKAPGKLADIARYEPGFPEGHKALSSSEFVYHWGTNIDLAGGGSGTILVHPKDAATNGGFVLMQDGSVKKMTADEFKAAAPKAR